MEMFLMALALSFVGVAVSGVLFAAAVKEPRSPAPRELPLVRPATDTRFFHREEAIASRDVPMEALLLHIERHVRLEQAAAESFVQCPTVDSLHSPTISRLVH